MPPRGAQVRGVHAGRFGSWVHLMRLCNVRPCRLLRQLRQAVMPRPRQPQEPSESSPPCRPGERWAWCFVDDAEVDLPAGRRRTCGIAEPHRSLQAAKACGLQVQSGDESCHKLAACGYEEQNSSLAARFLALKAINFRQQSASRGFERCSFNGGETARVSANDLEPNRLPSTASSRFGAKPGSFARRSPSRITSSSRCPIAARPSGIWLTQPGFRGVRPGGARAGAIGSFPSAVPGISSTLTTRRSASGTASTGTRIAFAADRRRGQEEYRRAIDGSKPLPLSRARTSRHLRRSRSYSNWG